MLMLAMKSNLKHRSSNALRTDAALEQIGDELHVECRIYTNGEMLSQALRDKLESQPIERRRDIAKSQRDGCAPLFIASKLGNVQLVEYLITICQADVEQKGLFEVAEDSSVHCVTPLWCAAVSGQLTVVQALLRHKASINAASDTGSTPVRSACFMSNLEMVHFLVVNGADIRRANYNGGTCLINSVQSVQLCMFLISKGADVNAKDIQDKTALHYAIQEHRLETTQLLLKHGADAFAKSRYGDDALQTSCLKGAHQIFDYLKRHVDYTSERLASAHELIGSTFLDEHNETRVAILHWRLAHHTRMKEMPYLEKHPAVPARQAYNHAAEFTTLDQLGNIELDVDSMRVQSLMICERVLGLAHKDTLFRLMFRGASYADSLRFQRCIDLWRLALQTRVRRFTILYSDTCFTAQALVRLMLDLQERHIDMPANEFPYNDVPSFRDVIAVLALLTTEVLETSHLLEIRPIYKKQQENFDRVLKCVTHLIFLGQETARSADEIKQLRHTIEPLIEQNVRTACSGDTLLHLCVSRLNVIKSVYFSDDTSTRLVYPNVDVVRFLLACGIPVNTRNDLHSTPLHIAANPYNFDTVLVRMLLDAGAHIDQPNRNDLRPSTLIAANTHNSIPVLEFMTLKCLAATVIAKYKIPYRNQMPSSLEDVVRLHQA